MARIEEAIHVRKFNDEYEKAIVNILYTASWLDGLSLQRLKPAGISPQQFNVLRILRGSFPTPLRLTDITERMIDKNSNATRLVEKLRQKGLVKREVCKHNRRQVDIWITDKGLELLASLDQGNSEYTRSLIHLKKEEVTLLNDLLDRSRG
jgi:DNA-binding MarR family transcriptional regulator